MANWSWHKHRPYAPSLPPLASLQRPLPVLSIDRPVKRTSATKPGHSATPQRPEQSLTNTWSRR
jgi:hypothetical protein